MVRNSDRAGLQILADNKIAMLNQTVQMCLDEKCSRYELPVFCINEPISYAEAPSQDRNLVKDFRDQDLQLTFRSVKYPEADINIKAKASSDIKTLKAAIKAEK